MTDGCGLINLAGFLALCQATGIRTSAIQGRIGGAKGVFLLHPDPQLHDPAAPPRIWIRKSQRKIRSKPWDRCLPSQLDLVRISRLTIPSSLNVQTIMNISPNGVPKSVFVSRMSEAMDAEIAPFFNWTGPGAMQALLAAVTGFGNVVGSRMAQGSMLAARSLGYVRDESEDADEVGDVSGALVKRNSHSGAPESLVETVIGLLHAGFHPLSSPFLLDKLEAVINLVIKSYVTQYHIRIERSAEAFIAPGNMSSLVF